MQRNTDVLRDPHQHMIVVCKFGDTYASNRRLDYQANGCLAAAGGYSSTRVMMAGVGACVGNKVVNIVGYSSGEPWFPALWQVEVFLPTATFCSFL